MSVLVCVCVSCANLDCSHVSGFSLSSVIVFFPLFSCFFSSLITGITNNSGVASVTVTGLSSDTSFTCSYSNVTDTCTVTVPSVLIGTSISEISLDSSFMIQWTVLLKDSNNTPLANKTLKFYVDGVLDTSLPFKTDANGQCQYNNFDIFDGTHTIKAVFEGDSTYEATYLEKTVTIGGGLGPLID